MAVVRTDYHPVWVQRVIDGRALTQKLWIGGDREAPVRILFMGRLIGITKQGSHPVAAAYRHGRLVNHDYRFPPEVLSNGFCGSGQIPEIGAPVRRRRRPDRNKDYLHITDCFLIVGSEPKPSRSLCH